MMTEMKTNNGKRLVATVAIIAMVLCAFAVLMPSSDAEAPEDTPVKMSDSGLSIITASFTTEDSRLYSVLGYPTSTAQPEFSEGGDFEGVEGWVYITLTDFVEEGATIKQTNTALNSAYPGEFVDGYKEKTYTNVGEDNDYNVLVPKDHSCITIEKTVSGVTTKYVIDCAGVFYEENKTWTLTGDVDLQAMLYLPAGSTIDLGGYTLNTAYVTSGDTTYPGIQISNNDIIIKNGSIVSDSKSTAVTITAKTTFNGVSVKNTLPLDEEAIASNDWSSAVSAIQIVGGDLTMIGCTIESTYDGIFVCNSEKNANTESNRSAKLTVTDTDFNCLVFAISGNNLQSAGSVIDINEGCDIVVDSTATAIYLPMYCDVTIDGTETSPTTITGGTGIELKMGNLTVGKYVTITGQADGPGEPYNGGSEPDGSAIMASANMYGSVETQYIDKKSMNITINGATLNVTGSNSYAISVYNMKKTINDTSFTITDGNIKSMMFVTNSAGSEESTFTANINLSSIIDGVTVYNGCEFNGTLTSVDGSSATVSLTAGEDNLSFKAGSVIISGTIDASSEVTIDGTAGTVTIDGTVYSEGSAGGLTISGTAGNVIIGDITLNEGSTLTIQGDNVSIEGTIDATAEGSSVKTDSLKGQGTINGNVESTTSLTVSDNMSLGTYSGDLVIESGATLIVENLTTSNITNKDGVIIVTGSINYTGDNFIIIQNGIPSKVEANSIYFTGSVSQISGKNYSVVNVTDPLGSDVAYTNVPTQEFLDANKNVVIVALNVNLDKLTITNNVIVAGTATGAITLDGGSLEVGTTSSGFSINGVSLTGITGLTVTGDVDTITISSNIGESSNIGLTEGCANVVLTEGVTVSTTITDGTNDVILAGVTAGTNGIVLSYGSVIISGEMVFSNGTITSAGSLTLKNVNVTGTGTIEVDDLKIAGTVTIGSGITIVVASDASITIEEDAVLDGEGTLKIEGDGTTNGAIYNNGTINVKVDAPNSGITVDNAADFINALPYYNNITVTGDLDFTEEELKDVIADTVFTIENEKKITVGSGVTITIGKGYTLQFINLVVVDGDNGAEFYMHVVDGGTLVIDNSDIFTGVAVDNMETGLVLRNCDTTITGATTNISDIGYGKTVTFSDGYTIGSEVTVYGNIVVPEGYALNISRNAIVNVVSTGSISVDGSLNMNGTLNMNGEISVNGEATVSGAVTNEGKFVVNGTTVIADTGAVSGTKDVTVNGNMTIFGEFTAPIDLFGTATIDGSANNTVTMHDGATLNVEKITGTVTAKSYKHVIEPVTTGVQDVAVNNSNEIELSNVSGLVIAATEEMTSVTDSVSEVTTYTYTSVFDLSGSVTAGTVTVENVVATDGILGNGKVVVTDTLAIADGAALTNEAVIDVTGTITVTDIAATVGGAANAAIGGTGTVNATYYEQTTAATATVGETVIRTYTTFENAVDAIASADDMTVTVSGAQESVADRTVTGTVVVPQGAKLTIGKDVTLTFGVQGYMLNGNTIDKMVFVDGTLVFEVYANYSEGTVTTTEVQIPKISADVAIIDGASRTYTSLANAIDMAAGEETTITLNQDVILKDDLTIPANITVVSDTYGIAVGETTSNKNVTLTVEGAVQLTGDGTDGTNDSIKLVTGAAITGATGQPTNYMGELVLSGDGYIYVVVKDVTLDDVTGAHYQKQVDFGTVENPDVTTVNVVSTVIYAAADSTNVLVTENKAVINIVGTNDLDMADMAVLTAPKDAVLTVKLASEAVLANTEIKISENVVIDASEGTLGTDDTLTNIIYNESTVWFVASGAVVGVYDIAAADAAKPEYVMMVSGEMTGTVVIDAGTVYFTGTMTGTADDPSDLTVFEGATAYIDGLTSDANTKVNVDGTAYTYGTTTINGTMTVSGTLTVGYDETAGEVSITKADVDGIVNISVGTMTITDAVIDGTIAVSGTLNLNGTVAINGTVAPAENAENVAIAIGADGKITVGSKPTAFDQTNDAILGGISSIANGGYVKAYNGASVSFADRVGYASTAFNVKASDGASYYLYMTVYAASTNDVNIFGDIIYNEVFALTGYDTGLHYAASDPDDLQNNKDTGLFNPANWYTSADRVANTALTGDKTVGEDNYTTLYAQVSLVKVAGTVTQGTGLNMYIDGVPASTMIGYGGAVELSIGTHTVSFDVLSGYNGDKAVITLNGQAVTDGMITITSDLSGFILAATGAVPADQEVVVNPPEVTVNNGSDDMSLTDILLIILVILIVIMAIIVALRMMRS